jgi:preprotein translocase SecE subunit
MARNRQKAKARKARREATGQPAAVSAEATAAANGEAGAPPVDEGTVKAAASLDAAQEIKRTAKLKPEPAPKGSKAAAQPKQRGRFRSFLRSSWAELRRVQWPDRAQVTTLTSIVIGFVIIAGLYLGVIDWVANKAVDFIIF